MNVGRQYNVRWLDAFTATNQDDWHNAMPERQTATTWGSVYKGKIIFEGKTILVFANTTFADDTHGDYIYIPSGLVIKAEEVSK